MSKYFFPSRLHMRKEANKFSERKTRGKWHVHTHLIVMNYDKFCFYDERVLLFSSELERFKVENLTRRVKEKSFQSFYLCFVQGKTQFSKTIKIIYYNPTSVQVFLFFIFFNSYRTENFSSRQTWRKRFQSSTWFEFLRNLIKIFLLTHQKSFRIEMAFG